MGCFASLAEKGLLIVRQKLRFFSYMCAVESRPLELCLLKNNFKFVQVIGGVRVVVVDLKEKRCACGELSTPIQQAGLIFYGMPYSSSTIQKMSRGWGVFLPSPIRVCCSRATKASLNS